jgi:hypothetical protein
MGGGVYLPSFTIEDLGHFYGVTDFLKKGGLARIRSPYDEDSKALKLLPKLKLLPNILSR